jgi:protein-S-isoprenylcysteine O-methyltransferase Ste14
MASHGGSVRGPASGRRTNWSLKALVGSGDRIVLATLPFVVVGVILNVAFPSVVIPWVGFLLDAWLGAVLGIVLYLASRRFASEEEAELSRTFGPAWDRYAASVKLAWL